jgi:polyphosphate kinase
LPNRLLELVNREAENARQGLPARIILKINSLADRRIIETLYRASEAGVKIDLIVRGICCLRPGLRGVSRNITVRSIVDRFLEHSRIYYFENGCRPEVFISSADWMPRNFYGRIELGIPIEDGVLRERIISEILVISLADNAKARFLHSDGSYRRATPSNGDRVRRSQFEFMALTAAEEEAHPRPADGKRRYPQVRLAPSPFAAPKPKK